MKYLIEVVFLVGKLVVEIGENEMFVCCVGLFYDIGKVIDYEVEGLYVLIGVEFMLRYKEFKEVIDVIVFYYGDSELELIIVVLVVVVDVLFVVCLGVRFEFMDFYMKCLI